MGVRPPTAATLVERARLTLFLPRDAQAAAPAPETVRRRPFIDAARGGAYAPTTTAPGDGGTAGYRPHCPAKQASAWPHRRCALMADFKDKNSKGP